MEQTSSSAIETHSEAHTRKRRRWLAWFTWVLYLALAFATLILEFANDPAAFLPNIFNALVLLAFATVGALIASRRPENPIGWLMCVGTLLWAAGVLAVQYAIYALVTNPGALPGGDWAGVLGAAIRGIGFGILLTYVLLLFPDGHLPSARWRPAVWIAIATQAFFVIAVWLAPAQGVDPPIAFMQSPLRLPIEPSTLKSLATVIVRAGGISVVVCCVSVLSRFRHAKGDERQQLKWFAYAALIAIVMLTIIITFGVFNLNPQLLNSLLFYLAVAGFPVAIGIAILEYRLYDIDLLINRTLVYVPLTGLLAGIFAASITLSQKLFVALTGQQSDAATVLTTLIVVAAFDPLKNGMQHLVDKRFKEVPDPIKKLRAYGDQVRAVSEILDVNANTQRLLKEAASAFDASSGAIFLKRDGQLQLARAVGEWKDASRVNVPLQDNGITLGELKLGARRNGSDYSDAERAALQQIADVVAHALTLVEHNKAR